MSQILYTAMQTGSDGNAGTIDAPFKSIGFGLARLGAGDTLLVGPGSYNESINDNIPSGTSWANKVRIAAYPGEVPRLHPLSQVNFAFYLGAGQHYIEWDGITIDGEFANYEAVKLDASVSGDTHHIRIMNAEVLGTLNPPSGGQYPTANVILVTQFDIGMTGGDEFINLYVHRTTSGEFGDVTTADYLHGFYVNLLNTLIDGCRITDVPGSGIQIYGQHPPAPQPTGIVVRNNIIYDLTRGPGGALVHQALTIDGTGEYYNNLIYNIHAGVNVNSPSHVGAIKMYISDGVKLFNNTIVGVREGDPGIYVSSLTTNAEIRNNIIYDTDGPAVVDLGTGTVRSNNLEGIDPKFVNRAANDYRLQDTSPCIDAGMTV